MLISPIKKIERSSDRPINNINPHDWFSMSGDAIRGKQSEISDDEFLKQGPALRNQQKARLILSRSGFEARGRFKLQPLGKLHK
jgi:hypothetical protein